MMNNRTIYFLVDEFPRLGGAETVTDRLASELTERGERVVVLAKTSGMKLPREGAYTVEYWSPLAFALKQSVLRQISLRQVPRGLFLFALKKSGILNKFVDVSAAIIIKKKIRRWNSSDIIISTRADILLQLISSPAFDIEGKPLIINQFHTSLNPLGEYGAFIEEARRSLKVIDGSERHTLESMVQNLGEGKSVFSEVMEVYSKIPPALQSHTHLSSPES